MRSEPAEQDDRGPNGLARHARRVVVYSVGVALVVVGLAGLVLPIIPGLLLIFVGLSVLAVEAVWAERLRAWIHERFPGQRAHIRRAGRHAARLNGDDEASADDGPAHDEDHSGNVK